MAGPQPLFHTSTVAPLPAVTSGRNKIYLKYMLTPGAGALTTVQCCDWLTNRSGLTTESLLGILDVKIGGSGGGGGRPKNKEDETDKPAKTKESNSDSKDDGSASISPEPSTKGAATVSALPPGGAATITLYMHEDVNSYEVLSQIQEREIRADVRCAVGLVKNARISRITDAWCDHGRFVVVIANDMSVRKIARRKAENELRKLFEPLEKHGSVLSMQMEGTEDEEQSGAMMLGKYRGYFIMLVPETLDITDLRTRIVEETKHQGYLIAVGVYHPTSDDELDPELMRRAWERYGPKDLNKLFANCEFSIGQNFPKMSSTTSEGKKTTPQPRRCVQPVRRLKNDAFVFDSLDKKDESKEKEPIS